MRCSNQYTVCTVGVNKKQEEAEAFPLHLSLQHMWCFNKKEKRGENIKLQGERGTSPKGKMRK